MTVCVKCGNKETFKISRTESYLACLDEKGEEVSRKDYHEDGDTYCAKCGQMVDTWFSVPEKKNK